MCEPLSAESLKEKQEYISMLSSYMKHEKIKFGKEFELNNPEPKQGEYKAYHEKWNAEWKEREENLYNELFKQKDHVRTS